MPLSTLKKTGVLVLVLVLLCSCATVPLIDSPAQSEEITVTLYFADATASYLKAEERVLERTDEPVAALIVKALIAGPREKSLYPTIPPETQLLGLEVSDGIAHVNFSPEIATKHWGGSTGELLTIGSLVNSLTELSEIKAVQFLIDGEIRESIWGHGITSEPIERIPELIAPN